MALSNWDTLSFGPDGEPAKGEFLAGSSRVSIYKNWLSVRTEDTHLATIESGYLSLLGIEIIADRYTPQSAVFVLIHARAGVDRYFCGIGCYGFSDVTAENCRLVGVNPAEYDEIWTGHTYDHDHPEGVFALTLINGDGRREVPVPDAVESRWVGVLPETYQAFLAWLDRQVKDCRCSQEYVDRVKAASPRRFNQGDAYLTGDYDGTPVGEGEVEIPAIVRLIKGL